MLDGEAEIVGDAREKSLRDHDSTLTCSEIGQCDLFIMCFNRRILFAVVVFPKHDHVLKR